MFYYCFVIVIVVFYLFHFSCFHLFFPWPKLLLLSFVNETKITNNNKNNKKHENKNGMLLLTADKLDVFFSHAKTMPVKAETETATERDTEYHNAHKSLCLLF